ncbi:MULTISPECIES: hypothetical protein [Bartonella]|uniref:hypothetical protein n=1 Tax=Bartonella TaxID=773 RepID=UPI0018DD015F|nr:MULTISPECIES: hypothetical protein [Bartonella]MBH9994980.1 hypothetical protein [Bartonella sp. P0291]MBH9996675.1 hypothetical protein [Bartonella sp. M0192]MBH9998835.1 hypothetical protein [Bartonella sp. M0191]MBI0007781.1 hypothetical protein [Bartonella sp. M0193]MBI0010126.1 hypothetical protein [Bartonella sp. M0176]
MFEVKMRFVVWLDDFATEQFFAKRVDVIILTAFADQAKIGRAFSLSNSIALSGTLRYERGEDQRRV